MASRGARARQHLARVKTTVSLFMRLMFLDPAVIKPKSSITLVICTSLWLAVFGNLALWKSFVAAPEISGWKGLVFGLAFALVVASLVAAVLSIFAWRPTLKPAITVLLLLAAFATYYMLMYGVVVNASMVLNVFQTDYKEARDQMSWGLLITVALIAVLPAIWIWRQPLVKLSFVQQLIRNVSLFAVAFLLAIGTLQLVFQDFASLMKSHTEMRYQINPLNSLYGVLRLTVLAEKTNKGPIQPLGSDAHIAPNKTASVQRPPLLVFVLGETARSQSFSLNGYSRPTNPLLAREDVTSFTHVKSCGTSTAESLPCMFSHLGKSNFQDRDNEFENLLDVLYRAGYAVLWIDNQSGCKEQCARIPNVNTSNLKIPAHCKGDECRDTVMLERIDEEVSKLPAERRSRGIVVVLHQMGSHGPAYFKRTPDEFKKFKPECADASLSQCDRSEIVNAYDNTILLTDYFLSRVIGWLKTQEKTNTPAMLYVSDHGESLGEKNMYLHGLPYSVAPPEQTTVPMITWLSPSFEQFSRVNTRCLQAQRDKALSHDNLFHSVLGLMAVKTSVYQRDLDFFATCEGR